MDASVVATAVTAEGFKLALSELIGFLKNKSSKYVNLKLEPNKVYSKAISVENVKTIWQVDRAVNLNDFYYPSKIELDSKKVIITGLNDFPPSCRIVVQGTAGQGKSIFLRYLTGQELRSGKRIPIFVELRKISKKNTLQSLMIDSLNDIGISADSTTLDYILESGQFSILLDAFDEIPEEQIKETLTYLDLISVRFQSLQIVVSSRPKAEIQKSPAFDVYSLCKTAPSDFRPILEKFFDDPATVDEVVSSIHKSAKSIADIITTPLLLTLLTITYKGYNKIPETPHEFYEKLFPLLVHRHDSTKPGFIREYRSQLNEHQLEKIFHAFCFYCSISDLVSLTRTEAFEQTIKAQKITKIKASSPVDFMTDCVRNTCLVVEEGYDFHFIHKSIREYHAAKFISDRGTSIKKKFYAEASNNHHKYTEELKYLSEIDSDDYNEFFFAPQITKTLDYLNWNGTTIDISSSNLISFTLVIRENEGKYILAALLTKGESRFNDFIGILDFIFFEAHNYIEKNSNEISSIISETKAKGNELGTELELHQIPILEDTVLKKLLLKCQNLSRKFTQLELDKKERESSF